MEIGDERCARVCRVGGDDDSPEGGGGGGGAEEVAPMGEGGEGMEVGMAVAVVVAVAASREPKT